MLNNDLVITRTRLDIQLQIIHTHIHRELIRIASHYDSGLLEVDEGNICDRTQIDYTRTRICNCIRVVTNLCIWNGFCLRRDIKSNRVSVSATGIQLNGHYTVYLFDGNFVVHITDKAQIKHFKTTIIDNHTIVGCNIASLQSSNCLLRDRIEASRQAPVKWIRGQHLFVSATIRIGRFVINDNLIKITGAHNGYIYFLGSIVTCSG